MNTKALRQKILDLAIHGKLVPQDPNDEPASVLLERIKAEKEHLIKEGKIKRSKQSKTACDKLHYPFELPEGWCWTTLGEISNYGTSVNIKVEDISHNDWILELEDIEKDSANIIQRLSQNERLIKGTRHKFSKGEILYSKLRTYLNKVLIAPDDGYCTTEIMPFNTYGIISNNYICHVLRSSYFLDYTSQCGYGVKMPRLSTLDACNGMIPLPPLNEQFRIEKEIERLFYFMNIIERSKEGIQETIKQAKSKILDLAIHGKLVPQDPTDEPASELLKRLNPKAEITCDNPQYGKQPFDIPQTWSWVKLGDIASSNIGLTYRPTDITLDGIPVYRSNNIKNGVIDTSDIVRVNTKILNKQFLNEGDLLICARNGSRNLVGKNAIIEKLIEPTSFGAFMAVCRSEYNHWIRILLNTEYFDRYLDNSNSATINQLTQNMLLSFHIPFPPLNEQHRIVAKIEELFAQLDNIASSL